MDVDRALVDIDVAAPHTVEQLFAGKYPPRPLHEKFEEAKLGGTQIDGPAGARDALFFAIELEIADHQHHRNAFGTGTPQERSDPRQQFGDRERLDDVVV